MNYSIMPNDQTNNKQQPVKKVRDHNGNHSPHSMPHRPESKDAISKTMKTRWAMLRQIIDQKTVTEDRVREIVRETIADYIKNNATPVNNNKTIDIRL